MDEGACDAQSARRPRPATSAATCRGDGTEVVGVHCVTEVEDTAWGDGIAEALWMFSTYVEMDYVRR